MSFYSENDTKLKFDEFIGAFWFLTKNQFSSDVRWCLKKLKKDFHLNFERQYYS